MEWSTKPQKVHLDMVVSWLRKEVDQLNNVLATIDRTQNYHDDYIDESLRTSAVALKQIKKFIDAN